MMTCLRAASVILGMSRAKIALNPAKHGVGIQYILWPSFQKFGSQKAQDEFFLRVFRNSLVSSLRLGRKSARIKTIAWLPISLIISPKTFCFGSNNQRKLI